MQTPDYVYDIAKPRQEKRLEEHAAVGTGYPSPCQLVLFRVSPVGILAGENYTESNRNLHIVDKRGLEDSNLRSFSALAVFKTTPFSRTWVRPLAAVYTIPPNVLKGEENIMASKGQPNYPARIRTETCGNQNPMPCRLATGQISNVTGIRQRFRLGTPSPLTVRHITRHIRQPSLRRHLEQARHRE